MTDEEIQAKLEEIMTALTNDGHSEGEAVTRVTDILGANWGSAISPDGS